MDIVRTRLQVLTEEMGSSPLAAASRIASEGGIRYVFNVDQKKKKESPSQRPNPTYSKLVIFSIYLFFVSN